MMNVLITGASSGIGRATAEAFIAEGFSVIGIDKYPPRGECTYKVLVADVTDTDALLSVKSELESDGVVLDAIINVAGIHAMASLVECDVSVMKRLI